MTRTRDILANMSKEVLHAVEVHPPCAAKFKVELRDWFEENGAGTVRTMWTTDAKGLVGVLMFSDADTAFWAKMAFA